MPITVSHVLSATTPDSTQEIRPSHWNSAHAVSVSLASNEVLKFVSAGADSFSSGTVVFSNSNGISFGVSTSTNGGTITASHNGLTSQSNQAFSAQGGSSAFQTLGFSNQNNVTFSNSNGSVVASASFAQSNQVMTIFGSSNTIGQSSSSTVNASAVSFRGIGAVSVGLSAGEVVFSAPAVAISAAGASASAGTVVFSNSNNVSFGQAGSTITASASQALQTLSVFAVSNTTQSSSGTIDVRSLSFAGAGIASVGVTNGSVMISVPAGGGAGDGFNFLAAGTQTAATNTTVLFSNSNGVSFGMSGSSRITASVATTVGIYGSSNTTGQSSSSTYDARSLSFVGAGIISIGQSNGSIQISAPDAVDFTQLSVGMSTMGNTAGDTGLFTGRVVFVGSNNITLSGSSNGNSQTISIIGGAGGGGAGVSAGTQSVSTGTVVYSNSNNISFGMSGSSRVTASYAFNLSGGTTSNNLNAVTFSNSNGVSFGLNGSTMTASIASSLTNINVSGGTTSNNLSAVVFSNSNGVSFGLNGSTMTGSVAAQTADTAGIYITAQSTGQSSSSTYDIRSLSFVGDGIVSMGWSGGTMRVSATQSNQAASASNGSFAFQTLGFSNANGVTFGTSAGSIISASVAATGAPNFSAGTTSSALNSVVFSNSNGVSFGLNGSTITASASVQTVGMYATGNTTQNSSTTFDARTLGTMNGLGAMTVGFSNGSIQISAPATSSLSATGQVSLSTNGSTISIGVPNFTTESGFNPNTGVPFVISQVGQASLLMQPAVFPNVQYDRVLLPIFNTNSTLSSGSHTLSFWLGVYTRNVSTLSLVGSTSGSTAVTHSGTQGSYSLFSGMRHFTIGSTTTLTAGRYWLGFVSRTTSGGADGSYSNVMQSVAPGTVASISHLGIFGVAQNNTQQFSLGVGFYSATTSGMPASIAFSQLNGNDPKALGQQFLMFGSSTV